MGYTKGKKRSAKKVTKKASPLGVIQQSVNVDDCRDAEFKELILTNFAERIWPTLRDAGFDSMKSYQGITDDEINHYFQHGFAVTARNLLQAVHQRLKKNEKSDTNKRRLDEGSDKEKIPKTSRRNPTCQCCHQKGYKAIRGHRLENGGFTCSPCTDPNCSYEKGHKDKILVWQHQLETTPEPKYSSEWVEQYHKEHGDPDNNPIPPLGTRERCEFEKRCAKAYEDIVRKIAIQNKVKHRLHAQVKKCDNKAEFVQKELPRQIELAERMYFGAADKKEDVELYELMGDLRKLRREEHLRKIHLPEVSETVVVEQLEDEKEKGNQLTIATTATATAATAATAATVTDIED